MKVNLNIEKAVKKLDYPIVEIILIDSKRFWHEKVGEISCYVVVYEKHTQYLVKQFKNDKTYKNYYDTYSAMLRLYNTYSYMAYGK